MIPAAHDIVIAPTGGAPERIRAVAHRTDSGGPSVGDEVCVITLADYWIEASR